MSEQSEKPRGQKKYTPTCLEWLTVMLNSTFHFYDIERDGFDLVYLPAEDGESIQMIVSHYANVDKRRMSKAVESGQRIALSLAESYEWDSWVNVEVDFREMGKP